MAITTLERERDALEKVLPLLKQADDFLNQVISGNALGGTALSEAQAALASIRSAFRDVRRSGQRVVVQQLTQVESDATSGKQAAQAVLAGLP